MLMIDHYYQDTRENGGGEGKLGSTIQDEGYLYYCLGITIEQDDELVMVARANVHVAMEGCI